VFNLCWSPPAANLKYIFATFAEPGQWLPLYCVLRLLLAFANVGCGDPNVRLQDFKYVGKSCSHTAATTEADTRFDKK
jgi:hypothetical protein